MAMMKAAPKTCHQTEMLLSLASRWLEKMLAKAVSVKITRKYTKIVERFPGV